MRKGFEIEIRYSIHTSLIPASHFFPPQANLTISSFEKQWVRGWHHSSHCFPITRSRRTTSDGSSCLAVPGLVKVGKAPACTQLVKCCVTFLHHGVLGFHFQAHWYLDPFNHPTEDDSKHLPKALQISQHSLLLSHLILTMTLSGEKDRLYFYLYFTEEKTEAQWH